MWPMSAVHALSGSIFQRSNAVRVVDAMT